MNELQVLTEEQAFGFLVCSIFFNSFVTIRLLKLTLMSSLNLFGFSHRNQKSRGNILSRFGKKVMLGARGPEAGRLECGLLGQTLNLCCQLNAAV